MEVDYGSDAARALYLSAGFQVTATSKTYRWIRPAAACALKIPINRRQSADLVRGVERQIVLADEATTGARSYRSGHG